MYMLVGSNEDFVDHILGVFEKREDAKKELLQQKKYWKYVHIPMNKKVNGLIFTAPKTFETHSIETKTFIIAY